jgi:hypothetical protein
MVGVLGGGGHSLHDWKLRKREQRRPASHNPLPGHICDDPTTLQVPRSAPGSKPLTMGL